MASRTRGTQHRQKLGRDFYCISAVSIFSKEFFLRVLNSRRPYLKRWPKHLPFDFEKKSKDLVAPNIISSLPNKEIFAAIDDDHDNPGYSLIARGVYPNRMSRAQIKEIEYNKSAILGSILGLLPLFIRKPAQKIAILIIRIYYSLL